MLTYLKIFLIAVYTVTCSIFAIIFALADRSFSLYFILQKIFSRGVLKIAGLKAVVSGKENIQSDKLYVFCSNHSSLFDIVVLQAFLPKRMSMVYKKELHKIPLFGCQLAFGPYIVIDRKNAEKALGSIEKAKMMMEKKRISILVYPEGTRSKTGEILPFKRGAFNLAGKVGHPVVPVTITGTDKIMPKGTFRLEPGTIYLHIDKPIDVVDVRSRKDEIDLMNKVREIIVSNHAKKKAELNKW